MDKISTNQKKMEERKSNILKKTSNGGRTSPRPIQPYPVAAYYQRVFQVPQQANEEESVPVPAIPIQMPLQASLSPIPNLQNVQLVPCVCPIQPEFEYDKPIDSNNNKNNIYVAPH
ncbi:hypothetical protein FQR65_LT01953 [Abscondita terminalis]|nr:hypothetical protein FQR65_LT01953 [Abscondita terminalis]